MIEVDVNHMPWCGLTRPGMFSGALVWLPCPGVVSNVLGGFKCLGVVSCHLRCFQGAWAALSCHGGVSDAMVLNGKLRNLIQIEPGAPEATP